jgi:hypothetical protein
MPKSKQPISQAIVFMIGGGSYIGNILSFTNSLIVKLRVPKFNGVRRVKEARKTWWTKYLSYIRRDRDAYAKRLP